MITLILCLAAAGGIGGAVIKKVMRKKAIEHDHYYFEGEKEVEELLAGKSYKRLCPCKKCKTKRHSYQATEMIQMANNKSFHL